MDAFTLEIITRVFLCAAILYQFYKNYEDRYEVFRLIIASIDCAKNAYTETANILKQRLTLHELEIEELKKEIKILKNSIKS